jgi:hypothetical protein
VRERKFQRLWFRLIERVKLHSGSVTLRNNPATLTAETMSTPAVASMRPW